MQHNEDQEFTLDEASSALSAIWAKHKGTKQRSKAAAARVADAPTIKEMAARIEKRFKDGLLEEIASEERAKQS